MRRPLTFRHIIRRSHTIIGLSEIECRNLFCKQLFFKFEKLIQMLDFHELSFVSVGLNELFPMQYFSASFALLFR